MSDFARQQADFQRGILTGDDAVLTEILDSPREKRETLYGVYRFAYGSRLVEALRNDHGLLHLYLGDETFDEMGHAYVKAHPSEHPNLRWFSQGLPDFLKSASPYCDHPVLAGLAELEKALNDAFDATEGPVLELTDMASMASGPSSAFRYFCLPCPMPCSPVQVPSIACARSTRRCMNSSPRAISSALSTSQTSEQWKLPSPT